jgi:tetratricopeptide (TPR) repeat protein
VSFVGNPEAARTLYTRAGALQGLKRYEEALACCDEAISLRPDYAEALNRRGVILAMLKRFDEALASFERSLAIAPASAEAWTNRGNVLGELRRIDQAVASYDQAIEVHPAFFGAHYCRALALAELRRFDAALAGFEEALSIIPRNADAWTHRGNVLFALKRHEEALASYDSALAIRPDHAKSFNDKGAALAELGRFGAALECYDKAISLHPGSAETLNNRGLALVELRRFDDALASYLGATTIKPDLAEAHFDEGLCRLLIGDFRRGWEKYEWRWKRRDRRWKIRDFPQPKWLGEEEIDGKTILLHTEQGLGDTIQFCRYASLAADRGAKVVLVVQPTLRSLIESVPGAMLVLAEGDPLPAFDLHCPLPSLPLAFRTTLDSIPARVPYLAADERRIEFWRTRLGPKKSLRVGLVWAGHPEHKRDRDRTLPLSDLALVAGAGCAFFSLQKDIRDSDKDAFESIGVIRQFGDELTDFSDTAALASLMDLIISVDTSVAHLAGAMGKPVWILLPHTADWRWLLDREDSPWYPTARLFRQPGFGDWNGVIRRVAGELARFASSA